jgi:hypothetical protein
MPPITVTAGLEPLEIQSGACRQHEDVSAMEQSDARQIADSALYGIPFSKIGGVGDQFLDEVRKGELYRMLCQDKHQKSPLDLGVLLGTGIGIA